MPLKNRNQHRSLRTKHPIFLSKVHILEFLEIHKESYPPKLLRRPWKSHFVHLLKREATSGGQHSGSFSLRELPAQRTSSRNTEPHPASSEPPRGGGDVSLWNKTVIQGQSGSTASEQAERQRPKPGETAHQKTKARKLRSNIKIVQNAQNSPKDS